jgi:acetyltransferase-like isoleucine patch superfamily enzyme
LIRRIIRRLVDEWRLEFDRVGYARSIGVQVGKDCRFLGLSRGCFGSEPYLIKIGDHVTITFGVRFITHDGGVWVFRDREPDIDVIAPIVVGNNVFIGINSIVLPGVTIGDNVVIGAGSVVTRDVEPNQVVIGAPARPLRTLDEYWERVQREAFYIRSLSHGEKRRHLEERFRPVLNPDVS